MIKYTHFQFTSGANPYITMTVEATKKFISQCKRNGFDLRLIQDGFYEVDDKVII